VSIWLGWLLFVASFLLFFAATLTEQGRGASGKNRGVRYTGLMTFVTRKTEPVSQEKTPNQSLFKTDVSDRVLLSVHLLGKPTADQLFRLHSDIISTPQKMRSIMASFRAKPEHLLAAIKPIDIASPLHRLHDGDMGT
jgi:hypothetical protein